MSSQDPKLDDAPSVSVMKGLPHDSNTSSMEGIIDDTALPKVLKTFTRFPDLIIELRHQIWGHAAHFPRRLPLTEISELLHQVVRRYPFHGDDSAMLMVVQKSKYPQPVVLQVCRESRAECMKYFELIFGTQLHVEQGNRPIYEYKLLSQSPTVYFNASSDTIFISSQLCRSPYSYLAGFQHFTLIASLRTIAIDVGDFYSYDGYFNFYGRVKRILTDHRHIQEIQVVSIRDAASSAMVQVELADITDTNERRIFADAIKALGRLFRVIEDEFAYKAGVKHLIKQMDEEGLTNHVEESRYQRPAVKIMGLVRGGTRV